MNRPGVEPVDGSTVRRIGDSAPPFGARIDWSMDQYPFLPARRARQVEQQQSARPIGEIIKPIMERIAREVAR